MSVISKMTGHSADAEKHTKVAHDYIEQWQVLGINHDADPPHTTLSYGSADSHGEFIPGRKETG